MLGLNTFLLCQKIGLWGNWKKMFGYFFRYLEITCPGGFSSHSKIKDFLVDVLLLCKKITYYLLSSRLQRWWRRRPEDTDLPRTTWATCSHLTSLLLRWENSSDLLKPSSHLSQCDRNNSISYLFSPIRQKLWGMNLNGWRLVNPWISWAWRGKNPTHCKSLCLYVEQQNHVSLGT